MRITTTAARAVPNGPGDPAATAVPAPYASNAAVVGASATVAAPMRVPAMRADALPGVAASRSPSPVRRCQRSRSAIAIVSPNPASRFIITAVSATRLAGGRPAPRGEVSASSRLSAASGATATHSIRDRSIIVISARADAVSGTSHPPPLTPPHLPP
ncbi:hypothetical protein TBS_15970 [Thermobispora bispora]|uniref:hypothetical protein n=1 Tax=Thermobispora bispora TaxID=2006 RepID=UPI0030E7A702